MTEVIQCAFCGAYETRPATKATPAPDTSDASEQEPTEAGFRFDTGRFAGKTIAEAAAHPTGAQYLEWAKTNVPRWRHAIESFTNNAAPSA